MVKLDYENAGVGVLRNPNGQAPLVLVVDDNPAITSSLGRLLAAHGYRTSICHLGADALRSAEDEAPVAALVDIHLPDISGLVLSQKLRERLGPTRPIIVLSGDTSIENIRSLPHVGADYFMSKPLNCGHLVERLREMVGAALGARFR
jgi:DNA-binding response OmpR family regulator